MSSIQHEHRTLTIFTQRASASNMAACPEGDWSQQRSLLPIPARLDLRRDEAVVSGLQRQQFLVRSQLHHAPVVDNGNDVSVLDGGETVGDHNRRAPLTGGVQRFLDDLEEVKAKNLI